jgi:acetyl esterase/lipase
MAQTAQLAVVSIGYRLAPEHPYPAGPEDCYDAGDYLVSNAESRFGAPLLFLGGESAGAHLSLITFLHLRRSHPTFKFRALILHFGVYDLSSWLPSVVHFRRPIIIDLVIMSRYRQAFIPDAESRDMRDPMISPFYADWMHMGWSEGLPPALFTIGTEDPLVDDSVMMAVKWKMAGAEAVLKVYRGAPHGFVFFDPKVLKVAEESYGHLKEFLLEKMK